MADRSKQFFPGRGVFFCASLFMGWISYISYELFFMKSGLVNKSFSIVGIFLGLLMAFICLTNAIYGG